MRSISGLISSTVSRNIVDNMICFLPLISLSSQGENIYIYIMKELLQNSQILLYSHVNQKSKRANVVDFIKYS